MSDTKVAAAQTVSRAAAVMRAIAQAGPQGIRISDLIPVLGLTRSTLHRLAQSLAAEGFLEQVNGSRRYRLGLELFAMASLAANPDGLRDICRPSLLRLCSATGDTVILLVPHGHDAVCLDRLEGQYPVRTFTEGVGGRIPLGLGSGPLVILAHMPEAERAEILRANMQLLIGRSVADEIELRSTIEKARQEGVMIFRQGVVMPAIGNVAVPILDRRGYPVAAVSITGVKERFNEERISVIREMLLKEKAEIEATLSPLDAPAVPAKYSL